MWWGVGIRWCWLGRGRGLLNERGTRLYHSTGFGLLRSIDMDRFEGGDH
jgi:hypothetical protein